MKKIIAMILIMVFCTCQYGRAVEIIVGSDGQAKYADGSETPIKQSVEINYTADKDNKTVVSKNAEEEKINIAVTPIKDANVNQADIDKIEAPYKSKNLKYINDASDKIEYKKALERALYYYQEPQKYKDNKQVLKFNLQDGDYLLWLIQKDNTQYAVEYHQDDSVMGVVEIKKVNKKTLIGYEYRSEDTNAKYATLKHIMIMYAEKNKEPVTFMYLKSGKLRCLQEGNRFYAIDLPNMPGVSASDIGNIDNLQDDKLKNTGTVSRYIVASPLVIVGRAVAASAHIALLPFGLLGMLIFGIDHY